MQDGAGAVFVFSRLKIHLLSKTYVLILLLGTEYFRCLARMQPTYLRGRDKQKKNRELGLVRFNLGS